MSLRVEQGNILLPTAWKPDLFWPDRNKTDLWNGKTKAFYLTFAWQKSVGKNTSRWSYVTKSATPKLMKKNLLEGSIQFLIILIKNYEKLYGALRDTYSASPMCLLHAVSFIYFWLQFFSIINHLAFFWILKHFPKPFYFLSEFFKCLVNWRKRQRISEFCLGYFLTGKKCLSLFPNDFSLTRLCGCDSFAK